MSFHEFAAASLRSAGPDARLWARSAAFLHQLDQEPPAVVDILVPHAQIPPELPGVRFRRTRAEGRRPAVPLPLPHTDVIDTVLDLADRTDGETCVYWLTEATRRGLVTMAEIERALSDRNRHTHRRLIRDIAVDIASGATSNLEVRYARGVERAHRLPRAERQFIVPGSTLGHRVDFAYPQARLLIEVDGLAFHQGAVLRRDAAVDAEHAALGWTTRRWTWSPVVGTPCAVAYEIAGLLVARGAACDIQPCRLELAAQVAV